MATPAQLAAIRDAVALADLWLDEEITFARLSAPAQAWRRADWTERTYPTWQRLVRPVVSQLSVALRGLMDAPDDSRAAAEPMLRMALSGMFAAQVGQSLGSLATTVVSSGHRPPLTEAPQVALLPTNVAVRRGSEAEAADILLFRGSRDREAATLRRRRLAGSATRPGEHYARDIAIDPTRWSARKPVELRDDSR